MRRHWFVFEYSPPSIPRAVFDARHAAATGKPYVVYGLSGQSPSKYHIVVLQSDRTEVQMDLINPFACIVTSPVTPNVNAPLYKTIVREYFYADVPTLCVDPA